MSTPISNLPQNTASVSTAKESAAEHVSGKKPTESSLRTSLNAQIIEASIKVSIGSGGNAQGLLHRSTLESIYEAIGGKFESQITPDYKMPAATGPNNPFATPEGTANVILSFSLGLYASYSAQHAGEDEAEMATNFINLIRSGFEKGYSEAVGILDALGVFNGNIKSEIEKTYELVMKGYDDFLASKLPKPETPAEPASAKVN